MIRRYIVCVTVLLLIMLPIQAAESEPAACTTIIRELLAAYNLTVLDDTVLNNLTVTGNFDYNGVPICTLLTNTSLLFTATSADIPNTLVLRDAMGSFAATTIAVNDSILFQATDANTVTLLPNPSTTAYTFELPPNAGTSGYVLTTDGTGITSWQPVSAVGGITDLNNISTSTQFFAVGTAGTGFNIVSAGNTHTFNIPLASGINVTGGVISNTDYTNFQNTYTTVLAATPLDTPNALVLRDATGSFAATNLTVTGVLFFVANNNTLTLQQNPATSIYTFELPPNPGTSNYVLTTDGSGVTSWQSVSAVGGITDLNNLTTSTQFFANGFAGIQPQFVSLGNTHTLNIPLASSYGVLAGLITSTDYFNFRNTFTTVAVGETITGDTGSVTGQTISLTAKNSAGSSVTFQGAGTAMTLNTTDTLFNTMIGLGAGSALTTGTANTVLGYNAGNALTSGSANTFMGYNAGSSITTGSGNVFIGANTGSASASNTSFSVAVGYNIPSVPSNSVLVGYQAAALSPNTVTVGYQAITTGTNSVTVGYLATTSGVNSITLGSQALVNGDNSVGIGALSSVLGSSAVGVGYTTQAFTQATTFGYQTTATTGGVAVGYLAAAAGVNSIAIGNKSLASQTNAIAIGNQVTAAGVNSIMLGGVSNTVAGAQATVIGGNSNNAAGFNSYALGQFANARNNYSFVYSDSTLSAYSSHADNSFNVRAAGGAYFDANITLTGTVNFIANNNTLTLQPNPATSSYILQLPINAGTSNYVLTTDGTGVTSWQSTTTLPSGITDLNNLTAQTQFFANGFTGIQPQFVSAINTHTLNIPLASTYGVLAGLITSTDYYNFQNTYTSVVSLLTGDIGSVNGSAISLKANSTAGLTVTFTASNSTTLLLNVTNPTLQSTFIGLQAGNTTGVTSVAYGYQAGNTRNDTTVGFQAGKNSGTGASSDVAFGALSSLGTFNGSIVMVGYQAGSNIASPQNSTTTVGASARAVGNGGANAVMGFNAGGLNFVNNGQSHTMVGANTGTAIAQANGGDLYIGQGIAGRSDALSNNDTRIGNNYIADSIGKCVFVGVNSGNTTYTIGTANNNSALGAGTLRVLTIGGNNTALGAFALANLTTGTNNIAVGISALSTLTSTTNTIGIGLLAQVTGADGIAFGRQAQAGARSIGMGSLSTVLSSSAVGIGYSAQAFTQATTLGYQTTATTGGVAIGYQATASGISSVAIGNQALAAGTNAVVINGLNNSAAGTASFAAGTNAAATANGSFVWADGSGAGLMSTVTNSFNVLATGGVFMQGINGANAGLTALPVLVSSSGQLGVAVSSARYKDHIKPMESGYSANLLGLCPVTFNYKTSPQEESFGLIAEEVHELLPQLVIYDAQGQPETVKYHELSVLLLNELKKDYERINNLYSYVMLLQQAATRSVIDPCTIIQLPLQADNLTVTNNALLNNLNVLGELTICGVPVSLLWTATSADIPNTLVLRDNTGSFAATTITVTGNIVLQDVTLAPNPATSAYTFELPPNGGNNNYVLSTNGSGVTSWQPVSALGGITDLNTLTTSTQFFAVGTAGTGLNIVSAGNTHTFNLPLASTVTVTGGVISNTDYTHFVNSYTTVLAATPLDVPNTLVLRDNTGSFVATNITATGDIVLQSVTLAPNPATSSYTFQLPSNGGTTNYVLTTNGSGVTSWQPVSAEGAITSLNGLTTSTQFFANGFAGIQPQFISAINTHTLNIPLASTYGVLAGLITSTDYFNFQNTYTTVAAGSFVITITGDTGTARGQKISLTAKNIAGSSVTFQGLGTAMTLNVTDTRFNTMIGVAAGNTLTTGTANTALGYHAGTFLTTGYGNVLLGHQAGAGPAVNNSFTTGSGNVFLGATNSVGGNFSSCVLMGFNLLGANNTVGFGATPSANGIIIGPVNNISNTILSIGSSANITGLTSTGIGRLSTILSTSAVGIGFSTQAFTQAAAFGYQTTATTGAVALGYIASATGVQSIAIGNRALVPLSDVGAIAIGTLVTTTAPNGIIIGGLSNTVTGTQASVIGGNKNSASGFNSYAFGQNANASNNYSFVYSDSTLSVYSSHANNSFNVRAAGGAYFDASITLTGVVNFSANSNTLTLQPNPSTSSYTFQLPSNAGFNSYVLITDGTGITSWQAISATGAITDLNNLSTSTQFFANGFASIQPQFNSAINTHTLNIPMASTFGVLAGLITSTDYFNFHNTYTTVAVGSGFITTITGDSGSAQGSTIFLTARSTAGSSVTFRGAGTAMTFNTTDTLFNTMIGLGAGNLLLAGSDNTALGYQAGNSLTTGALNTFVGYQAGLNNTTGSFNTFNGYRAGAANTTGINNTFVGYQAGLSNTTASSNSFAGSNAGTSVTTGGSNTILGYNAGSNLITGTANTLIGANTGSAYTGNETNNIIVGQGITGITGENSMTRIGNNYIADTTSNTIFVGVNAGNTSYTVSIANNNSALGVNTLSTLSTGTNNTALGAFALSNLTTGINNIAVGVNALSALTNLSNTIGIGILTQVTGADGIALGRQAQVGGQSIGIGSLSTVLSSSAVGIGYAAQAFTQATTLGYQTTATTGAVAIGYQATASGISSVAIGSQALAGGTNAVVINGLNNSAAGTASFAAGTNAAATANGSFVWADGSGAGLTSSVANSFNVLAGGGVFMPSGIASFPVSGSAVLVNTTNGQLGTISSSRRYKENIKPMTSDYSSNLLKLQPVTFNYKTSPGIGSFGLIAEDVQPLFPQLVIYNTWGQPETVKYHELPVLLLNELKKSCALTDSLEEQVLALTARPHGFDYAHPERPLPAIHSERRAAESNLRACNPSFENFVVQLNILANNLKVCNNTTLNNLMVDGALTLCGLPACSWAQTYTLVASATSQDVPNTLVLRDNTGSFAATTITVTGNVALQSVTLAANPASNVYTFELPPNGGANNYVLTTNGAGVTSWQPVSSLGGIIDLNNLTTSTQFFAVGTAGIEFNIVSAGNTHTFNVPLASTPTVTGGTISNTDYTNFQNTYTTVLAATPLDMPNTLVLRDNTGSFAATTITVTGNIALQSVTLAQNPATSVYTFELPANGGTSNYVLTTDGTGVTSWQSISAEGAITSLNGLTTSTQFFANGFAGIQPAFNSAINTHTLNIPLASSYGVLAGLITSTDYFNFQNTYTTVAQPFTIIGDVGSVSGSILTLKANGTAGGSVSFIASGTGMTLNVTIDPVRLNTFIGNGTGPVTNDGEDTALGYRAGAVSGSAGAFIAIGYQAVNGNRTCSIGYQANGTPSIGYQATGVGYLAAANGIGYQTVVAANSGAIGASSSAGGTNSTAIGFTANTAGVASTAVGTLASARSPSATGVGYATLAFTQATALGYQTTATTGAVAIGYLATATGINSIAIGNSTLASLSGGIAIGNQVTAAGVNSIMLGGISNILTGTQATIIGGNTTSAAGFNSYALGQFAQASNNYSFVYSDSTLSAYSSHAANSFNVRAAGGAYFDANITLTGAINFVANGNTSALKANPSTTSYTFQLPVNGGTNGFALTTDGTGVTSWQPENITAAGIVSLNGLTASSQFFANGFAGIQPAFNSAINTHTLNIPLASSYGVLAGLITSTDYYNFKLTSSYITTITGDTGTISGRIVSLQAHNTAGSSVTFQGVGSSMTLNVTDSLLNTIIGNAAGNRTLSGTGNTVLGYQAGSALTTGSSNVFIGYQAGLKNTTGSFNTFTGSQAGDANTTGTNNTFVGVTAGLVNTIASGNTFMGSGGKTVTTGGNNTVLGSGATSFTTGTNNTFVGSNAGTAYTSSESNNIILGFQIAGRVGENNVTRMNLTYIADTASNDIFVGPGAGNTSYTVSIANNNSALGVNTLSALTTGTNNTALGAFALAALTTGTNNIAIGVNALSTLTNGSNTIGIGFLTQVTGADGIAFGRQAQAGARSIGIGSLSTVLSSSAVGIGYSAQAFTQATTLGYQTTATTGAVAIGYQATASGISSVAIGNQALAGGTNAVVINGLNNSAAGTASFAAGTNAAATANGSFVWADGSGAGLTSSVANSFNVRADGGVFMQGINGITVGTSLPVLVDTTNGQLGTIVSSKRYKDNIKPMSSDYSSNILKLQPVTFNYKISRNIESFGLIAEDVHELFPQLVIYNAQGEPESVKYHELPVLLLNELKKSCAIKEHLQQVITALLS